MRIFSLALILTSILGCSREGVKELAKLVDPAWPMKRATHVVELFKVQISEADFNNSTFGNPLDIKVQILQDGQPLGSQSEPALISGTRGERFLKLPIRWTVDFNPKSNYQIKLEEQAIIANAVRYSIPATPKIGYWPIGHGKLMIGKDSYIEFREKIAD